MLKANIHFHLGGWLTGKMVREKGSAPEGSRVAINSQQGKSPTAARPNWDDLASDERTWNILDSCKNIAEKHNKTIAQVKQQAAMKIFLNTS